MSQSSKRSALTLLAGALFGAGLALGGMTDPAKVLGFLDVFGAWNPSLLFVMGGAVGVHFFAYRLIRGRSTPLFAERFVLPDRQNVDRKLVLGAAVFGVGWGLAGYCPGPSLVALPKAAPSVLLFVGSMIVGLVLTGKVEARLTR